LEPAIIAQIILAQSRSCFKLGDVNKSLALINSSLQVSKSKEAEEFLKEVERMAYFESLIEYSKSYPLYPQVQNGNSNNTVGVNLSLSNGRCLMKMQNFVPHQKYIFSKEKEMSWQNKFVNHTKSM